MNHYLMQLMRPIKMAAFFVNLSQQTISGGRNGAHQEGVYLNKKSWHMFLIYQFLQQEY